MPVSLCLCKLIPGTWFKGMDSSACRPKCPSRRLEDIDEDGPASCLPVTCAPPETPIESMEFLARSWSLSAMELSKALTNTRLQSYVLDSAPLRPLSAEMHEADSEIQFWAEKASSESLLEQLPGSQPSADSPPMSPRGSEDTKELFLLHQALNPDFLSNQQLLRNGLNKSVLRGKTVGRWLKDQKEKKKQELRTHKAHLHAAVSVAGVATAIAALAASSAMPSDSSAALHEAPLKTSATIASAAALVASHCVELAEEMGADRDQILAVVDSAINVRTSGDILTLTAGAATALRGAAILRARQQKGHQTSAFTPAEEQIGHGQEPDISSALHFVSEGGELLKRTRKGALHWKHVSFYVNSNWQVVVKMKSKNMVGSFTKKKCVVSDVYGNIPAWPGRETEENGEQRAYFGIQTDDRLIEFECRSKYEKQMWTDGIQLMLHCRTNMT